MNTQTNRSSTWVSLTLDQAFKVRTLSDRIPSPCLSVCRIVDLGGLVCEGCWRSLDEIARWGSMNEHEKKATWAQIEKRIAVQAPGQVSPADSQDIAKP